MIEDVHEPLKQYEVNFKTAHLKNTSDLFEKLVLYSGVNEEINAKTVKELRELEQQIGGTNSDNKLWRIFRNISNTICLIAVLYVLINYSWLYLVLPAVFFGPVIYWLTKIIKNSQAWLKELEEARDAKYAEAWKQMEPLNQLFEWDIAAKLTQKTIPHIMFDSYFSNGRIDELRNNFGWSGDLGDKCSIVFTHSGILNGNPFVLARTLTHWMGQKTYHGSLEISWTERVRDSDGEWRTQRHHQTLNASVEHPFPQYDNQTFIVYGNEAAPDLLFSRSPSNLSKLEEGFFDKIRKNRAIQKLEKKSRQIVEGKTFSVMSNREFDALFDATDRNNEVQFRLLFTPLAQQEMLKLLKDNQVGYGDDFQFNKKQMINVVEPLHMRQTDIGGEPEKFHNYDLAQSRIFFNSYNNEFFRSFYFGIAPLLAIPLYQQHRPHSDIYKDNYAAKSSFWEHEAIANYHGEAKFKHSDCSTRSILKTTSKVLNDGSQLVTVTSNGYGRIERVDYVAVQGGDGRSHEVPIHWHEYYEVQNSSDMLVREMLSPTDVENNHDALIRKSFEERRDEYQNAIHRRSIDSVLFAS